MLTILLIFSLFTPADEPTKEGDFGTIDRAKRVVACILKVVEDVYPYIVLAMFVMGGMQYIAAGDDNQARLQGKQFLIIAVVGGICVVALIAFAESLEIETSLCRGYSVPVEPTSTATAP